MAKTFSNFLSNIVKKNKIPEYQCVDDLHNRSSSHPALQAILKYKNHLSMNNNRNSSQNLSSLCFSKVDTNTVIIGIRRLNAKKAVQDTDILVKVLKENAKIFAEQICCQFIEAIYSSKFPATFKFSKVTPVFKQGTRNLKHHYRPISILPIISKIFEKLICRQLSNHFNNIFSKFQCAFRKDFIAQHCLLLMIDKWRKALDNSKVFGALLTDLSKVFHCICHNLLPAKLHAYELPVPALK